MNGSTLIFGRRFAMSALLVVLAAPHAALACPFCGAPGPTLSERLDRSETAALTQWVEATKGDGKNPGKTTFLVVQVAKSVSKGLRKGDRITVPKHREGRKGELFMLLGGGKDGAEWDDPLEVSETGYYYVVQGPSPETQPQKRLRFYLRFLESSDPLIAQDAFAEFANARYEDVVALTKSLPREKLHKWVKNPKTTITRVGFYGMLLGLCGTEEDARLLEAKIDEKSEGIRLGIDGIMGGYLLLKGVKGLNRIDRTKLKDKSVPFTETYAAMQALRFMWTYGGDRIGKDRLKQSMRLLLDRPNIAGSVVRDLARWKDWEVQDRLMQLYGQPGYDDHLTKLAIARFLIISSKNIPADSKTKTPPHIAKAKEYLEQLRKKDPKLVREAGQSVF